MPDLPNRLGPAGMEIARNRSVVDAQEITCYKIPMPNTARLADQFNNLITMHTFAMLNAQFERGLAEQDFDLQMQTYEVWETMINDVVKYVPAANA